MDWDAPQCEYNITGSTAPEKINTGFDTAHDPVHKNKKQRIHVGSYPISHSFFGNRYPNFCMIFDSGI